MSEKPMIPFAWIVHGCPLGQQSNATRDDRPEVQGYYDRFHIGNPKYVETPSKPGEKFIKETLPSGTVAYTIVHTGIYEASSPRPGSNYAAITIFVKPGIKLLDEQKFAQDLKSWFNTNILSEFTYIVGNGDFGTWRQWSPRYRFLFANEMDNSLAQSLNQIVQKSFSHSESIQTKQTNEKNSLVIYASNLTYKGEIQNPTDEPNGDTNWVLTQESGTTYKIVPYEPAYQRILSNPSKFLDGAMWQGSGNHIEIQEPGKAVMESNGKLRIINKPIIHLDREMAESKIYNTSQPTTDKNQTTNNTLYADFIDDGTLSHVTQKPNDDTNLTLTKQPDGKYKLGLYEPAYPRILRNPAAFLQGTVKQVIGRNIVKIKEFGVVREDAPLGKFIVEKKLKVHLLDEEKTETLQQNPEPVANNTTKKKLYSITIIDGELYRPKPVPDEYTNFELTETSPGTYEIDIYKPAYRRILANPSFLDGCTTTVLNGATVVKVLKRGIAKDNGMGKLIVEKAPDVHLLTREMAESKIYNTSQPTTDKNQTTNNTLYADFIDDDAKLSHVTESPNDDRQEAFQTPESTYTDTDKKKLYADSILNGRLCRVRSTPYEDTVFELTETSPDVYEIDIYPQAYGRILANSHFLEGCKKQIVGNKIVKVMERGIARKDAVTGKLFVETPPNVYLLDREMENTNTPESTKDNKIKDYDTGRKLLEQEIERLEQEIERLKQKTEETNDLLKQKRAELAQMENN